MADWYRAAACAEADPGTMQPDSPSSRVLQEALAYCARCPVLAECREDAERQDADAREVARAEAVVAGLRPVEHGAYGVWGGQWWGERRKVRVADVMTREQLVRHMADGWTDARVAEHYGVTAAQVKGARESWGVTGQTPGGWRRRDVA